MLPLVEEGVSEDTLAMLKGVEWVAFDPANPDQALRAIAGEIARLRANKQYRQDVFVMLAIVAGLLVVGYAVTQSA